MYYVLLMYYLVLEGHVEADVRMLGPQSCITLDHPTSQEDFGKNGGISRH